MSRLNFSDSNAGELLRYRKSIDADEILVFNDIKKKHSSHQITSDVSLLETAHAAKFFQADAIILTGKTTGAATDLNELKTICDGKINLPVIIGSGVTLENFQDYIGLADAVIIGSHFKVDGHWKNELCEKRICDFMKHANELLK